MKNLSLLIFFALLFASCSSDEPVAPMTVENAYFDKAYSTALINGTADAVFQWKEVRLYDRNSLTNGGWKEVDLTEYLGWSPSQSGVMIFEDGKLYTELASLLGHLRCAECGQPMNTLPDRTFHCSLPVILGLTMTIIPLKSPGMAFPLLSDSLPKALSLSK